MPHTPRIVQSAFYCRTLPHNPRVEIGVFYCQTAALFVAAIQDVLTTNAGPDELIGEPLVRRRPVPTQPHVLQERWIIAKVGNVLIKAWRQREVAPIR